MRAGVFSLLLLLPQLQTQSTAFTPQHSPATLPLSHQGIAKGDIFPGINRLSGQLRAATAPKLCAKSSRKTLSAGGFLLWISVVLSIVIQRKTKLASQPRVQAVPHVPWKGPCFLLQTEKQHILSYFMAISCTEQWCNGKAAEEQAAAGPNWCPASRIPDWRLISCIICRVVRGSQAADSLPATISVVAFHLHLRPGLEHPMICLEQLWAVLLLVLLTCIGLLRQTQDGQVSVELQKGSLSDSCA